MHRPRGRRLTRLRDPGRIGRTARGVYMPGMLADLIRRLTLPAAASPLDAGDAQLALAALLVRVARVDGHYDTAEQGRIGRILARRYGLGPFDMARLLSEAEELETRATDTVRFTRLIKDEVPYEEREGVMEALWEVVLADGARNQDEDAILRLTANLLGVNDRDSALARQRVEAREGNGGTLPPAF